MTPTQPNSSSSPFPATLSQDQQLQPLYSAKPQEVSSSSSLSSHVFTYSIHDQRACHHRELHLLEYQQQAPNFASHGGSHDHSARDIEGRVGYDQTGCSAKWMSSKMRLMKKMMTNPDRTVTEAPPTYAHQMKFEEDDQKQPSSPMETDHSINNNSSSNNSIIRVCADCNTTKTPLWRSGPKGPKTLCNACGIRQRKARRAMAAAAASANDTILAAATSSVKKTKAQVQHTDKRSNNGHGTQFKKRSKLPATPSHGREKLCFEDFLISLSKNLAFHQVFPQDEKEAAILLMALSCGLVHG